MENNIVNLSLKKEEETPNDLISGISDVKDVLREYMTEKEIESLKQSTLCVPPLNHYFEGFAEIVSESLNKISKLFADIVECFNKPMPMIKSLADMCLANNKLKMQGKPMRRFRAYAKIKNKRRTRE